MITGTITDLLDENHERVIVASSTGPSLVVHTCNDVKCQKITPSMNVGLNQHNFAVMEIIPASKDPIIKAMELFDSIPDITYDDIGGLDDQLREVRESVELPLLKPGLFKKIGIEPPKGVLFQGPSGTGKTLIAKAVAHHAKTTFIKVIASELVQKFIGEGSRYVREIFELAREKAPTIVFIDEIDAIGATRMEEATSGDREVQRTLLQLLSELDGFEERGDVKFIAATNRVDILDGALLRPGRFDRIIEFPIPDDEARYKIFKIHMKLLKTSENIDIKKFVEMTVNATGADIKAICTEAGMFAIRKEADVITEEDFFEAINKVMKKVKVPSEFTNLFI
jgi:proteasome regulatory subunit